MSSDHVLDPEASRVLERLTGGPNSLGWTPAAVKRRLEEAAHICERMPGRIGPSWIKSAWPDRDLFRKRDDHDKNCIYFGSKFGTRGKNRRVLELPAADEIGMMESAIYWPARYLSDPKHDANRRALQSWLWCSAKRRSFDGFLKERGVVPMTAYRRIDRAAKAILEGLVRDGIKP